MHGDLGELGYVQPTTGWRSATRQSATEQSASHDPVQFEDRLPVFGFAPYDEAAIGRD